MSSRVVDVLCIVRAFCVEIVVDGGGGRVVAGVADFQEDEAEATAGLEVIRAERLQGNRRAGSGISVPSGNASLTNDLEHIGFSSAIKRRSRN